jgi:hypothetical protein
VFFLCSIVAGVSTGIPSIKEARGCDLKAFSQRKFREIGLNIQFIKEKTFWGQFSSSTEFK